MTTTLEGIAYRMFIRNVADYAEPALAELAWIDPDIRSFWVQQAQDVVADFTDLAGVDVQGSDNRAAVTLSRRVEHGADPRRPRHARSGTHNA
jgi:hypothetical protein